MIVIGIDIGLTGALAAVDSRGTATVRDIPTFPDGQRFEWRVWKEMFRGRFLGDRWVMRADPRWDRELGRYVIPKRKTPRRERVSTEDLSIKQYSAYIDIVIDTAVAEFGIVFDFVAAEREAVRYVKPTRRKALKEATA